MDAAKNTGRKNFKCIFNDYITKDNRDAVIQSIISQFQGYFADPEVTVVDNGFILSLTTNDELNPVSIRDKILWNRFIERVTTQDSIRKIQILRLPQSSSGSVGGFGPHGSDSGVDEIMILNGKPIPHMEYKIDNADRPDGPPFIASVKHADPTSNLLPAIFGPGAESGKPVDEDLKSDITEVDSGPKRVLGFRIISFDSDTGGSFTMTKGNQYDVKIDDTHELKGTNEGLAMLPRGNFFNTSIENERGSRTGVETTKRRDEATSAPLVFDASKTLTKAEEDEAARSAVEISQSKGGGQSVPDGGQIEGWYASSFFGLNETYNYVGDIDDDYFI